MGHHCCSKQKVKRGLWSPEEDEKLIKCITSHGHGCWSAVPKLAGLQRCGKSCRLRWINYLRPDLKRGSFSSQEERIIIDCHRILGNRWAQIAKHLPGRTDNEVKNFWNSCIKKKLIAQGLDPKTHNLLPSHQIHNNIKNACNVNQFYQQPSSVFSINTQIRSDASMDMNQSFITLLPPHASSTIHPPLPQASMSISTLDYQNQNHVWPAANDQNSPASTYFANQSSITPLSSTSMNPSGLGFLDHENCLWSDGGIESMVTPTEEEMHTAGQVMQQDKVVGDQVELEARDNGQDMNTSFSECSNFDLEFMESPLISCGLMYNNMNSMDHQLSWDS